MLNINLQDHDLRRAELIQEANKYRLIRTLREKKTASKGFAQKAQSLINTLTLP